MKVTRDWFIEKGSEEIKDENSSGVAYLHQTVSGKWCAMGFGGKRQKPDFNYWFPKGEQDAREYIAKYFKHLQESEAFKVELRRKRQEFRTTLQVDDILYASWGYDQTNIDWYQVVEVKPSGKTVIIRPIAGKTVDGRGHTALSAYTMPVKGEFIGEPMTKRVGIGNALTIEDYASAFPWDGNPKYYSWGH